MLVNNAIWHNVEMSKFSLCKCRNQSMNAINYNDDVVYMTIKAISPIYILPNIIYQ